MKGEWCYFKSHFSKEYCDLILDKTKDFEFKKAFIGETGQTKNDNYRKSDITWIYEHQFPDLYQEMWRLALIANKEWFGFHIDNIEYVQLARYDSKYQGEYKVHQDVFWVNSSDRHRKLTAVVQLTDPNEYEGGDLVLHNCAERPNKDEMKQQGSVIFFPSFLYHSAEPVTKGIRHSLALWFEGPKWR